MQNVKQVCVWGDGGGDSAEKEDKYLRQKEQHITDHAMGRCFAFLATKHGKMI